MEKIFNLSEFGYKAVLGKFAGRADSGVWLQQGGTVVFVAMVSAPSEEFPGFFPLTIDYREQFSAAGKIPGGYLKREGRSSDHEILIGRLIDRALRPLFPENYFNKVMISATVYSVDGENMPHTLALCAASLALTASKVPFMGPVGVCDIARINGEWIFNPTYAQAQQSDVEITVAGNIDGVNMVEGSAQEISEEDFVHVMFKAHEIIKKQIIWQQEVQREMALPKEAIVDFFDYDLWSRKIATVVTAQAVEQLFEKNSYERRILEKELEAKFLAQYDSEIKEAQLEPSIITYLFDIVLKETINELIFKRNQRLDGRDFTTVRSISTEVNLLPCNHGSALFQRGGTQALVSVTLGGGQDQVRVDSLMGEEKKTFMLHYNFPSFSVGEVRPSRGPGRREIGHGYLAASAIERVLPSQEKFPYTIRVISDILESDGSSSMATVCGSTMSLMGAGVPISAMVSGVAMGLLMSKSGQFQVLTDIAGIEDSFGLMDFKVAGTQQGITAIQMDIKYKGGLPREVFEKALAQAKAGRLHIMKEMQKVMDAPNKELSPLVPQIVSFKIAKDKIGAVIGTGGKIIREIIEQTTTSIDIEDDGLVKIFGHPGPLLDKAVAWVKTLAGQIEIGAKFSGVVKRLADFGIFVEIVPGQDGLVHISSIPRKDQTDFMKKYAEGSVVAVEVIDYDKATGRIRLKIVE